MRHEFTVDGERGIRGLHAATISATVVRSTMHSSTFSIVNKIVWLQGCAHPCSVRYRVYRFTLLYANYYHSLRSSAGDTTTLPLCTSTSTPFSLLIVISAARVRLPRRCTTKNSSSKPHIRLDRQAGWMVTWRPFNARFRRTRRGSIRVPLGIASIAGRRLRVNATPANQ